VADSVCRWNTRISDFSHTRPTRHSRFGALPVCQRDLIEAELAAVEQEFRDKEKKLSKATHTHQVTRLVIITPCFLLYDESDCRGWRFCICS
jgi:hypothetical protein